MKKKKFQEAYDALVKYVSENGKKNGDIIYWDTHPVCFKDKCPDAVAVRGNTVMLCDKTPDGGLRNLYAEICGDENAGIMELMSRYTIDHVRVAALLEDMKSYDKKKK